MKCYCLACNNDFETDVMTVCPCCGAVGDDLEPYEDVEESPSATFYTDFSLEQCLVYACETFGLETEHTLAIAALVDAVKAGGMNRNLATIAARIIVHDGSDVAFFSDIEPNDEEWEEPDWGDEGFDPYMGCYTGDC